MKGNDFVLNYKNQAVVEDNRGETMSEQFFGGHYLEKESFYDLLKSETEHDCDSAIVLLDFDNFNYINDLFSFEVGDKVLNEMTRYFDENLESDEYFTRIHADYFVFIVQKRYGNIAERFVKIIDVGDRMDALLSRHYAFSICGGIVEIKKGDTLKSVLDRANSARKEAKANGVNQFYYYDKRMSEELEWRKIITMTAETALRNREFVMYLQPKIQMDNRQIVGAEALVRWIKPNYGLIAPDRFIPILEKNGFVRELDYYMLEEACKFLKKTEEDGLPVLPISVNFSKLHLHEPHFATKAAEIVDKYQIPHKMIELEMTENIFSEELERLVEVSGKLKTYGFRVSLDDFGRAYSSLNYLKDIPLDIIKIDKGFLDASDEEHRGRVIIAKMVDLIKSLRMVSVMEGVETEEQVNFLKELGCDVAQGFYFAKPMPKDEYEKLLRENRGGIELSLPAIKTHEAERTEFLSGGNFENKELYLIGKNLGIGLIKGELSRFDAKITYINDRALTYFGYTRKEILEHFGNSLLQLTVEEDRADAISRLEKLAEEGGSVTYRTRIRRKIGDVITIEGRSAAYRDIDGKLWCLHSFRDVTSELSRWNSYRRQFENKVSELEASNDRLKRVIDLTNDILFEWVFKNDTAFFTDKEEKFFTKRWTRHNFSVNPETRKRIHPADLPEFEQWVREAYKKRGETETEFRLQSFDGNFVWMKMRVVGNGPEGKDAERAIGVLTDIDKQKKEMNDLMQKSRLDPLTRLLNKEETKKRIEEWIAKNPKKRAAFAIVDIDNFKGVNDNLGHQFGDSVLRELSRRISSVQGKNEVVGRLGGDEIVIFMTDVDSERAASEKMENLLLKLRGTYFGANAKYVVSTSAGVSLFPKDSTNYDELYRMADVALYESKRRGKDCFTFYRDNLSESASVRTPMEWSDRFLSNYFEGDLTYNVLEQLYETNDIDTTINMILELLGKRYNVDRAYVFEHHPDGEHTSNTYEWCADGIAAEKDSLQMLSVKDLKYFLDSFGKEGILCRNDIAEMDPYSYRMLKAQNIKSMLHCAISDGGKMSGFIGFDMCREARVWSGDEIAILGYISRILSVFLLKRHALQDLQEATRNYGEVLDKLGELVYVIDDDFNLQYFNAQAKKLGFRLGKPCYTEIFNSDKPCKNCPVKFLKEGKDYSEVEFRVEKYQMDMIARVSKIRWKNGTNAALICCSEIKGRK